jgi:hypothetical protein
VLEIDDVVTVAIGRSVTNNGFSHNFSSPSL